MAKSCPTLCNPMDYTMPGFPVLHYLQEFAQIHVFESVMLSNHLIYSVAPFSLCLQSLPASGSFPVSQFFPSHGQSIGASATVLPNKSNEYSGLISFRMDWVNLLAVQGTLKSLLQHHSLKASGYRWSLSIGETLACN